MAADVVMLQHACSHIAGQKNLDWGSRRQIHFFGKFPSLMHQPTFMYCMHVSFKAVACRICHIVEVPGRSLAEPRNGIKWLLHRAHKVLPLRSPLTAIEDVKGNDSWLENWEFVCSCHASKKHAKMFYQCGKNENCSFWFCYITDGRV